MIRMTTPLLLMAFGGTWTLQTGILNISQEGAMLLAAFSAAVGSHYFGSWVGGLLCGIAAAVLLNLIFALLCVNLNANVWVVGMTLNLFADSLSILILKSVFNLKGTFSSKQMVGIPDIFVTDGTGAFHMLFGNFSLIVWITFILMLVMLFVDRYSVFGIHLKAAGEKDAALAASGVNVVRLRYKVLAINGVLVGMAGSFLSISYLLLFNKGMSAGRGWMAVAAVIFGDGKLMPTIGATLAFGFAMALGNSLQLKGVPSELALMLPYIVILAALTWKAFSKYRKSRKSGDIPCESE